MSTVKSKNLQVGTDATASNNFTIYQPSTPDGTLRIGVGNADSPTEVGRFDSNGYKPATAPAFGAWASGQSFAHNTWTKLTCSNEVFDTNSNYDNATNYRFTPTVAGYYQINGNLAIPGTSGICVVAIWKNNALAFSGSEAALVSAYTISNVSAVFYMNGSTDYVELYGIQTSGTSQSSLNAASGAYNFFNGYLAQQS